jgi:uncharacterized membrane protein YedE/YeeE
MLRNLFAFLAGGLFGAGLLVSGMTDTTKVIGWLDIFGDWDPTLAFVMGGAILPMAVAWNMTTRRARAVLGTPFPEKPDPRLGRNLVLGSVMFGAGWGLAGLCPGPAMASITWGGLGGVVFLVAMLAGMYVQPWLRARLDAAVAAIS